MITNGTKPRETKLVALRLDPEIYERTKQQADREGMYINRWLERAIKHELARTKAAEYSANDWGDPGAAQPLVNTTTKKEGEIK